MSLWEVKNVAQAQGLAVQALLDRLRPSVAILGDPRRPTGAATLIDAQQGLFVAHRDAVQGDTVQARVGESMMRLRVVNRDTRTNLVLLSQNEGAPRLTSLGIPVAEFEPKPNATIVVLLADGGLVGSYVGGQKVLLLGERHQAVPASELRFETPPQLVAGALILDLDGRLVGTINSTVARTNNVAATTTGQLADVRDIVQGRKIGGVAPPLFTQQASQYGPTGLTVAFTPSLIAVRRTVNGFLSESHRPDYAGLGLLIKETPIGVVIARIVDDSPASRTKIRVGDILLSMNDRPIVRQYDFVQSLWSVRGGDEMAIRVRHDGTEATYRVTLARIKG